MKNVSSLIKKQALAFPEKKAIVYSKRRLYKIIYSSYTFQELDRRISQMANRLKRLGVKTGDKVLFFVKPNLDFCAITFALFRMGATVVFIDPGMKKRYFFECIKELKPDVLIGIPKVQLIRHFLPSVFNSLRLSISTGHSYFGGKSLLNKLSFENQNFEIYQPHKDDLAAILYTSGGTGKPKGVEYTHDIFIQQTDMLKKEFNLSPKDIDIPGFPLFSFFTLAMGMTSVIPLMNPAKPAQCNPKYLYQNIIDSNASFMAGSPAIWERLAAYCSEKGLTLPTVKYLVMFGAPVKEKIHRQFSKVLTQGTTFTPYGATECLPITNFDGRSVLTHTLSQTQNGQGICVGKPLENVEVKIIKNADEIIDHIDELDIGAIGEIIVHSKNMTCAYYQNEKATKLSKIYDGDKLWHRMGDMGYLDTNGLLWFCGRKKHIVKTKDKVFYPVMVEEIFNQLEFIKRSALVLPSGHTKPVLIIEKMPHEKAKNEEIEQLLEKHDLKGEVEGFYFQKDFPVDTRHNIKIDRIEIGQRFYR